MNFKNLLEKFDLNSTRLIEAFSGISHTESITIIPGHGKCLNWVLGNYFIRREQFPIWEEYSLIPIEYSKAYTSRSNYSQENYMDLKELIKSLKLAQNQLKEYILTNPPNENIQKQQYINLQGILCNDEYAIHQVEQLRKSILSLSA